MNKRVVTEIFEKMNWVRSGKRTQFQGCFRGVLSQHSTPNGIRGKL